MRTVTSIGLLLMLALTALKTEALWFIGQCRAPRIRGMQQFAEDELIIPKGPFENREFTWERQPYTRLLYREIDSGRWQRHVITGPTQSGKSFSAFVIPTLYHLFEHKETVICGLPDLDMAVDKWTEDLLPAIEKSPFREFLPRQGAGSKGGKSKSIRFLNGATLKFMSGGGNDKARAAFTSRVLIITETDGMDEASEGSREADKITQMEARTRAYGSRKRIYMECTVSIEEGRTWSEYQKGTASRIVLPCPYCRRWVTPERDSLVGWQSADNVIEAKKRAAFSCPSCNQEWTEGDRTQANLSAQLLHRGQEITDEGEIVGELPATDTLGFRWSAVNNIFLTAGDVASDEFKAQRSANEDNAEKEMRQFVWAMPYIPEKLDLSAVSAELICRRTLPIPKGHVPSECRHFAAAIDLGKHLAHWVVVAWCPGGTCHFVDYGRIEVAGSELGVERGIMIALRQFRDACEAGWRLSAERSRAPELVLIDSGYMANVVYEFCLESGPRYMPVKGFGSGQAAGFNYHKPKGAGPTVIYIGEECHVSRINSELGPVDLVEANADHWKSFIHARATTKIGAPGAMTLFHGPPQEHLSFAKHLTSEKQVEEYVAGKGNVVKWVRQNRNNHWFDTSYMAAVCGHLLGMRLNEVANETSGPIVTAGASRPDGRSWLER